MAEVLFDSAPIEGRTFALTELQQKLREIESMGGDEFAALKKRQDIDRALPRLVAAATLTDAFGYSELVLTGRELGSGLIIEAEMKRK